MNLAKGGNKIVKTIYPWCLSCILRFKTNCGSGMLSVLHRPTNQPCCDPIISSSNFICSGIKVMRKINKQWCHRNHKMFTTLILHQKKKNIWTMSNCERILILLLKLHFDYWKSGHACLWLLSVKHQGSNLLLLNFWLFRSICNGVKYESWNLSSC